MPIEWSKLKPYKHDRRRSFEELCYQIAKSQYSQLGSFTSIDDSGGGDGVEFYLTLPNGDEWGWQAKFYFPDPRLTPGRKSKIINSLKVSLAKHSTLKKWFLCTPTSPSPNGKKSEVDWFKVDLQQIAGQTELVHWGESDLLDFLKRPALVGAREFFFGELELTEEWFRKQVQKQLANIGSKYIEELHTSVPEASDVHSVMADRNFLDSLEANAVALASYIDEIEKSASKRLRAVAQSSKWKETADQLSAEADNALSQLRTAVTSIRVIIANVENGDFQSAAAIDLETVRAEFTAACDPYFKLCDSAEETLVSSSPEPSSSNDNLTELHRNTIDEFRSVLVPADNIHTEFWKAGHVLEVFWRGYLHILADAGFGKTHLTAHMALSRINEERPTILLLGEQFGKDLTIENRIREICDIPSGYSWDHFLAALEACSEAHRSRVVILIDGLNEAVPVEIWKRQLAGFMAGLRDGGRIVLITTTRSSYRDHLWGSGDEPGLRHLRGFSKSLREAVQRYFHYFKINADPTFDSIDQFNNPLYLRIFCEAVNSERDTEKSVFVGQQYTVSMFEKFLEHRNRTFSRRVAKPVSANLLQQLLRRFARRLWKRTRAN